MKRLIAALLLALAALGCVAVKGRRPASADAPVPLALPLGLDGRPDTLPDAGFIGTVRRECSLCHVTPSPSDLPRGAWRQRLQDMARFSLSRVGLPDGQRSSLAGADLGPFTAYFEARARESLPEPAPWPAAEAAGFDRHLFSPPGAAPLPILASTRLFDLDGDGRLEIVACDMGHGLVFAGDPLRAPGALREIAKVPNPVRSTLVDLDKDGLQDLLIADIGFFMPEDHDKGAVVWLRANGDGRFEKRVLAEKLPRVTDVEAGDFDGDGDLDLVVAAFGLHTRGSTLLLENRTSDWREPVFEAGVLDSRAGAIQAQPADLDRDGRLDVVLLLAQQHEAVVALLNRGGGRFEARPIWTAATPAWGSTGIDLVDFDGDGDPDVLLTSGDTLDDPTVKPYHGVGWLENRGTFPFERHELAAVPGAHRARAGDLDGDGDNDVVVAAFLPDPDGRLPATGLAALGWLEQKAPGEFVQHTLQSTPLSHTTLDLGDVDRDGDLDVVVGSFVGFTFARTDTGFRTDGWVELWENRLRSR